MISRSFPRLFAKTHDLLEKARSDVFPDYAVGVSFKGNRTFSGAGCGLESLFDLASLSKVICTTTLVAICEKKGLLSTRATLKEFYPQFSDEHVRLSHLLDHSSGFPAWLPLHSLFHDENGRGNFNARTTPIVARARYEEEILGSWRKPEFEKQAVYSDLGFMLLGWILEKLTHTPLDALFQEWIVYPTGLESLQFLPTSPDVVPTENCPWRGHVLRGEVHDDNCYVLGGIAGHAGLFGNIGDVLAFGEIWLNAFRRSQYRSILTHEIAKKYFTRSQVTGSSRALGWDSVTVGASSTGRFFSSSARGHLGFTGTSLWIDPEHQLVVTLLTNRVHPSRTNDKIKSFRPLFHDTLMSDLGLAKHP